MLKTRYIDKIDNISLNTKKISSELKSNKEMLYNELQNIKNYYQGKEIDIVIDKLKEATKKFDNILENIDYYGNYLEQIANTDRNNLDTYHEKLMSIYNDRINNIGDNYE